MKPIIRLIHALDADFEVIKESTIYAPSKMVYIMNESTDFLEFSRVMASYEYERNEWIRKYENVLQGLVYWRNKALIGDYYNNHGNGD